MPTLRRLQTTMLPQTLENHVALVTGASRGIGLAIAKTFAQHGAKLALVARTSEALAGTLDAARAAGVDAEAFPCDLSDAEATKALSDRVLERFGQIDILVNNAGITRDTLLLRMSDEDWQTVMDTNLRSAFLLTRAVVRPMMKARRGRIINISSVSGLIGNAGQANYAASKAALIALTKTTAREFASRGITANAIAPGFITTDMTSVLSDNVTQEVLKQIPLGRFGAPEDIAYAALFLASPAASYITGQTLIIDGGLVMP